MSLTSLQFRKLVVLAARQADQKKADDIILLDLRHTQIGLCDFALIMSATSEAHIRALHDSLEQFLGELGLQRLHRDGGSGGHWLILDYGGLLIHIFHHASRSFYTLERLWENARHVDWGGPQPAVRHRPAPKSKPKPKKKPARRKSRKSRK